MMAVIVTLVLLHIVSLFAGWIFRAWGTSYSDKVLQARRERGDTNQRVKVADVIEFDAESGRRYRIACFAGISCGVVASVSLTTLLILLVVRGVP